MVPVQPVLLTPVCRLMAKFAGATLSHPEFTKSKARPAQPPAMALPTPLVHIPVSYQYDDVLRGHTFSPIPPFLGAVVKHDMVPSSLVTPPRVLVGNVANASTTSGMQAGIACVGVIRTDLDDGGIVAVVIGLNLAVAVEAPRVVGGVGQGELTIPAPTSTIVATDGTPFATTNNMYGPGGATLLSGGVEICSNPEEETLNRRKTCRALI